MFVGARLFSVLALLLLVTIGGMIAYQANKASQAYNDAVDRSYRTIQALGRLKSTLQDAETGQRGYLLTGKRSYLEPYQSALAKTSDMLADAAAALRGDPEDEAELETIRNLTREKLDELGQTIALFDQKNAQDARDVVLFDRGKQLMDALRAHLDGMMANERGKLDARLQAASFAAWRDVVSLIVLVLLAILSLIAAAVLVRRGRINELRQASLLNATMQSLSQSVAVFGANNRLLEHNGRFASVFGLPTALLARGAAYGDIADYLSDRGKLPFLETTDEIAASATTGADGSVAAFERKRADGKVFEIRRSALEGGGFVITFTDQTQRVQVERALMRAQRMEALGQLTSGLAHDFNNLLQVIMGSLDAMRRGPVDVRLNNQLATAIRGAERAATITHQLLAFARRQPLAPVPINANSVISNIRALLRRSLDATTDLEVIEAAGLWTTEADPAQLESAVLNLVVNARDAMPKGGKITIETGNASLDDAYARVHGEVAAGQYVMLAVTDTGAGMRPEIAERAFEPFFTTKPEGQGTGLGLSQVFGFVKQSRGHVKLDSEPGVGTTVKVYLPRTMEAATPIAIASAPPEPTPAGSEVILVVEDDEDVLISVVEQLRYLGYKTITATTAHEALSILQSDHKIDLLFTDVVLPGTMKGGQLASRAVDIRPGLPVLFTSGFTQNSIVHGGVIDPGAALISKPYKIDVLAVRIREILQRGPEPAVEDKA